MEGSFSAESFEMPSICVTSGVTKRIDSMVDSSVYAVGWAKPVAN